MNYFSHKWGRLKLRSLVIFLILRALFSRSRVTQPDGPIVSLTSHGRRLHSVCISIESIAKGFAKPSRLILWVDDEGFFKNLPFLIRRQIKRGLEVHLTNNYGPHTKYFPTLGLISAECPVPLVTADDDIIYPVNWLQDLVSAYRLHPTVVNAFRAHVIQFNGSTMQPYSEWVPCESDLPRFRNFATGVSGVIYPPALIQVLKQEGSAFLAVCPKADDVWLHCQALRAGFKVRQLSGTPRHFPVIPGTEAVGLMHANLFDGGNDVQIRNLYSEGDVLNMLRE